MGHVKMEGAPVGRSEEGVGDMFALGQGLIKQSLCSVRRVHGPRKEEGLREQSDFWGNL